MVDRRNEGSAGRKGRYARGRAGETGAAVPLRPRFPGWLLIGATVRNIGKTEFACAVIEEARRRGRPVVGVKVAAVARDGSACPRGGDGCGVCSSLEGDYRVDVETGELPGKDTTRMLESGASRVLWLRCRRNRMDEAMRALASWLEPGALVVAESNTLARAIEPDLFIMVEDAGATRVKPSAAAVMGLANRLVTRRNGSFDLDPRHLVPAAGKWHLVEASAAILAGGSSRRMGEDKSLLSIGGKPLIRSIHDQLLCWFNEVLVSTNEPARHGFLGARTVSDLVPGQGPLMGIRSVVEAASHERVFVTACDIPVVHLDTVIDMLLLAERYDCVVARSESGTEPLFAVYGKSALSAMREALEAGERRIDAIFPRVRTAFYDLGTAPWYRNLNTREDLAAFLDTMTTLPTTCPQTTGNARRRTR